LRYQVEFKKLDEQFSAYMDQANSAGKSPNQLLQQLQGKVGVEKPNLSFLKNKE